jgi:hypothetical protein
MSTGAPDSGDQRLFEGVTCMACGQVWLRDPAREVAYSDVGFPCQSPSWHGCAIHADRDRLAMERGFLHPAPRFPSCPLPPHWLTKARNLT